MPWVNDEFYYTYNLLKAVINSIKEDLDTIEVYGKKRDYIISDPFSVAEHKADITMATRAVGKDYTKMIKWLNGRTVRARD